MNPLSQIAGMAVDRVLGLPSAAAPYTVRPDVGAAMPDGVVLLGDHYRPDGPEGPGAPLPRRAGTSPRSPRGGHVTRPPGRRCCVPSRRSRNRYGKPFWPASAEPAGLRRRRFRAKQTTLSCRSATMLCDNSGIEFHRER